MPGIIIPLYAHTLYPGIVSTKAAHPSVDFIVILNPSSGPGTAPQASFTSAITAMKAAGIKVLGYVFTSYGTRPIASVEADIDKYVTFYPDIIGINFDEFATSAGQEAYYGSINTYAKS